MAIGDELETLLREVRARYEHIRKNAPGTEEGFLEHLRSVARYHKPRSYPDVARVEFPPEVPITFAVCQPTCGNRQFIVEGGPQECDCCGSLMFRATRPVTYRKVARPRRLRKSTGNRRVSRA
jgi:hypothetical protein